MVNIDWESSDSHVMTNPRQSKGKNPCDWENYTDFPGHIWMATSGTTNPDNDSLKWATISKKAFLVSAASVNQHLSIHSKDRWGLSLPLFHVGGLSIYARAYLSGSKVEKYICEKWDPLTYTQFLEDKKVTLTSLVPTQIFDLVSQKLTPPSSLRGVLVGGGALSAKLYDHALKLAWPLLPTYGMTECASQIATADFKSPGLKILPHVTCSSADDGTLKVKSDALLSGYLHASSQEFTWHDPKVDGWFMTEDRVTLHQNQIQFLGRADDFIKICGENVSLLRLETWFDQLLPIGVEAILIALPDDRLGFKISVVTLPEHLTTIERLLPVFNREVMPYERIREIKTLESFPRNSLGKIIKKQLINLLNQTMAKAQT